jgi:protein O-mannosyl-transferase
MQVAKKISDYRLCLLSATLLLVLGLTYLNHFDNGFHFDDTHTIVNNLYIRDASNFSKFFTDVRTFGSMPDNLGYRPLVTASTALDYAMGGGLKPFWFHFSQFVLFVLQGVLMFFLFRKLFRSAVSERNTDIAALFAVAVYMLHPGSAETINYIIARSDSYSTFFVIAAILCFVGSKVCRKFHLYMIPAIAGLLCKETAAMFPLLLFFYVYFFDEKASIGEFFTRNENKKFLRALKRTLPAILLTIMAAFLIQYHAAQQTQSGFLHTQADSLGYHYKYILTQPWVLLTYFITFIAPVSISADPDITVFSHYGDPRMYAGFLFLGIIIFLIVVTSRRSETRPIAFGLAWFLIAAIPTSVLAALTQVANSHRLFFLYPGLAISIVWMLKLFIDRIRPVFPATQFRRTVRLLAISVLLAFAVGTWQRNRVWHSDESLWKDIVEKSPGNPRALMNYGLIFMARGEYFEAEYYFRKALKKWPTWTYLHINMGILNQAQGKPADAEQYFLQAINCAPNNGDAYYYYGLFLSEQNRTEQAILNLLTSVKVSPGHLASRRALMKLFADTFRWTELKELAEETLQLVPGDQESLDYMNRARSGASSEEVLRSKAQENKDPAVYLELSLSLYNKGDYKGCIQACEEALKIKPDFAEAWNNICSAYNAMQQWEKGAEACEKALQINPSFERAANNLQWAKQNIGKN